MAKKKNGGGDDGVKKQKLASTVVLKMDLHCEGCAGKIVRAVRTLDGVESVRIGDSVLNKLTVIGNVDPVKLRQKVEEKTRKKVELVISSSATKKPNHTDAGGQKPPPQQDHKSPPKTVAKKKPKELPVTTGVLRVPLHCQGCVRRIHKFVSKTKGYMEMSLDKKKELVTVKGAIDMKLLAEALQRKLKRVVEIIPPKKLDSDEKKGGGGGEKKKGGEGAAGKGNGGGGDQSQTKAENGLIGYPVYAYGPGYADYVHAPQLFSDENPNACRLM